MMKVLSACPKCHPKTAFAVVAANPIEAVTDLISGQQLAPQAR